MCETPATPTPVAQVVEAEAEPPAPETPPPMPTVRIIDMSHQQISREQKAQWKFIADGVSPGTQIWFVGMGVFVVTSH